MSHDSIKKCNYKKYSVTFCFEFLTFRSEFVTFNLWISPRFWLNPRSEFVTIRSEFVTVVSESVTFHSEFVTFTLASN